MYRDIRLHIGLLFTIIGLIVTIFGFVATGDAFNEHSFCVYISVWSGICLIAFGAIMLFMAFHAQKKAPPPTHITPQR